MPEFKITIRNYRSIPFNTPLSFEIKKQILFVVGVNNVGKTNLLRLFHELRPAFIEKFLESATKSESWTTRVGLVTFSDHLLNQNSGQKPMELEISTEKMRLRTVFTPEGNQEHTNTYNVHFTCKSSPGASALGEEVAAIHRLFVGSHLIPTMRSVSAYNTGSQTDTVVGSNFLNQFGQWANGDVVSKRRQMDTLIQEMGELFGYRRFDLQLSENKNFLIVKSDDGTFKLEDLGEGIGHFIVVLVNALFKQPSIILIDEPEIGLHPKMQELFIRTLASKSELGVFASSHAIGLARSAADTIMSLARDGTGGLRLSPFGEHHSSTIAQSIYEMGYSQFVEIGGNNLLLVEGKTDIKAFREILRKFGIENKFIIWQLGGSSTIVGDPTKIADELNELKRLNARSISVIFDSERTAAGQPLKPAFQKFKELCEGLRFKVFDTDLHSTENYVTQQALDKLFPRRYTALQPFEPFSTAPVKWQKESNWLLFREMDVGDLKPTGLGVFIEQVLKPLAS